MHDTNEDIDNPLGIICWPVTTTSDVQIRALLTLRYRHLARGSELAARPATVEKLLAAGLVYQIRDGRFALTGAGLTAAEMVLRCARRDATRSIALAAWGQKSQWVEANVAARAGVGLDVDDVEPSE